MNRILDAGKKFSKSHFCQFGLPMLTLIIGGSYFVREFQVVKVECREEKYNSKLLKDMAMKENVKFDLKSHYEALQKVDTSDYKNIRGPRAYEDNEEFIKNREAQEERANRLLTQVDSLARQSAGS